MNTNEWTSIFKPDAKTIEAYEVYRRSSDIYRRTNAAMGRAEKYKVVISSAINVKVNKK
jgi:hypothetical protein